MRDVVLALGSNLGDSVAYLQRGIDVLAATAGITIDAVSPVYRTAPVGGPEQPDYLNAVALARTTLTNAQLLAAIGTAEAAAQRVREERWGPRTLDIDVVAVGQELSDDPALTLPHPRAHERAFVLVPWHDVDPDAVLVGHGSVGQLLLGLDAAGVQRTDARLRVPDKAEAVRP